MIDTTLCDLTIKEHEGKECPTHTIKKCLRGYKLDGKIIFPSVMDAIKYLAEKEE